MPRPRLTPEMNGKTVADLTKMFRPFGMRVQVNLVPIKARRRRRSSKARKK